MANENRVLKKTTNSENPKIKKVIHIFEDNITLEKLWKIFITNHMKLKNEIE